MIGFRSMHELREYASSSDLELAVIPGAFYLARKCMCTSDRRFLVERDRPDYSIVLDGLQACNLLLKVAAGLSRTRTTHRHMI